MAYVSERVDAMARKKPTKQSKKAVEVPSNIKRLFRPLEESESQIRERIANLGRESTEDLNDDLMMIWLDMPASGYGDIAGPIRDLRLALIEELRTRPPIPVRARLIIRLGASRA